MNGGKFDGGGLSDSQKYLRDFYSKLLNIAASNEAITRGEFYELMLLNLHEGYGFDERTYAYLRYTDKQRILVVTNFSRNEHSFNVKLPPELLAKWGLDGALAFKDMLGDRIYHTTNIKDGIGFSIPPASGLMLAF
jgi:hypothetical protein